MMADHNNSNRLGAPSKALMGHADGLMNRGDYPILDVGCGYGRNAVALAALGASVVCVDRDLERLRALRFAARTFIWSGVRRYGSIYPICANVHEAAWPFASAAFSAIICVHFPNLKLLPHFADAIVPGGHLYVETFENRGGNYYDLPRAGEMHDLVSQHFTIQHYKERKAGPPSVNAVTANILSMKN